MNHARKPRPANPELMERMTTSVIESLSSALPRPDRAQFSYEALVKDWEPLNIETLDSLIAKKETAHEYFNPSTTTARTIPTLTTFNELTNPEDAQLFLTASNATPAVKEMKGKMSPQEADKLGELILEKYNMDYFFNGLDIPERSNLDVACDVIGASRYPDLRFYPDTNLGVPPLNHTSR